MVGAQKAKQDAGKQQTGSVTDGKVKAAELEVHHADHQADNKEGAEGEQIGNLTVNSDKADAVGDAFYPARFAANLQHIAFIQDDAVIDRHLNLAANDPVEEAAVIGEVKLAKAAVDHVVVFDHDLFGDDAHIKQIAIEHLFTVAKAGIEPRMRFRVANQRDLVAFLQYRVTVRAGKDAVATDALYVAAGLPIDAQFSQVFTAAPRHQLCADAIGTNHRQINLALAVGIQTTFPGNLLGAGR